MRSVRQSSDVHNRNCGLILRKWRSWWGGLTVVESARTTTIFTTWPNPTQTRTKFLQGRSLKVDWPRVLCWCCNTDNLHMLSVHLYTGDLPLLRSLTKILWDSLHCCVPPVCRALCIPGFRPPVTTVTKMTDVHPSYGNIHLVVLPSWLMCSYNSTLDKNRMSKGVTKRLHRRSSVLTSAETPATLRFHAGFFRKMLQIIPRLGQDQFLPNPFSIHFSFVILPLNATKSGRRTVS